MGENELTSRIDELNSEIYRVYETYYPDRIAAAAPITDGVYDAKKYLESRIRILWLLKEPYCKGDGTGGGWDLSTQAKIEKWFFPIDAFSNPTYATMAYASYGILRDVSYERMPWINENDFAINKALLEVAHINISKMPARTRSNPNEISDHYPIWKDIIFSQIRVIKPEVIICGNTFSIIKNTLCSISAFKQFEVPAIKWFCSYEHDSQLVIDAYHPAQTQITREIYVDSLKEIVNQWMLSKTNTNH
jgi:hypothetical protein